MALARLVLRSLQQKLPSSLIGQVNVGESRVVGNRQKQRWNMEVLKRTMASSSAGEQDNKMEGTNVSVPTEKKSSRLSPRRRSRRSLWRNTGDRDLFPSLYEFVPSGLGNALMQATENINRLFDNMSITPSRLLGRVKAQDDCYKLRYEVPGMDKEDLKVSVDDGVLRIKGEHAAEEEEEFSDGDGVWSAKSYGHYDTSVALPEDAEVDGIKAELKNGVLTVVIPRTEKPRQDVREIDVK